jgi:N-acetylglucosamine malate deacetylase 1
MTSSAQPKAGLLSIDRVLVLAPHTDDEMGCAGTIRRLVRGGATVRYVALSRCEESVPAGFASDVLEHECRASLNALGVAPENVAVWDFKVRYFPDRRQDILERFVKLQREFKPQLVLLPNRADIHQDHATVSLEGLRAFKHSTVLGYELPQNATELDTQTFVELEESDVEDKIRALGEYKSQSFRNYSSRDVIMGMARLRGMQCNARYAEAFEAIRITLRLGS